MHHLKIHSWSTLSQLLIHFKISHSNTSKHLFHHSTTVTWNAFKVSEIRPPLLTENQTPSKKSDADNIYGEDENIASRSFAGKMFYHQALEPPSEGYEIFRFRREAKMLPSVARRFCGVSYSAISPLSRTMTVS